MTADVVAVTVAEPARAPKWRGIVAITLLILGGVLLPIGGVAVWVRNMLLDTDRYVETVKPLGSDPVIIQAGATAMTDALFNAVDVEGVVRNVLPSQAAGLATAITAQIHSFVEDKAVEVMSSDAFEKVWTDANRIAHTQVKELLLGNGHGVVVDLRQAAGQLVERLSSTGIPFFDNIPIENIAARLEIFHSDDLETARDMTDLLQKLAVVLPILAIACFIGSIFVATNRRKGVKRVGWAIIIGSSVLLISIAFGRSAIGSALSGNQRRDVADSTFETVTRYLRLGIRTAFVIGLVLVLAAWMSGPGKIATKTRAKLIGAGADAGSATAFTNFLGKYRSAVVGGVCLIAVAILMSFDRIRPRDILIAAIIVAVIVVIVLRLATVAPESDEVTETAVDEDELPTEPVIEEAESSEVTPP